MDPAPRPVICPEGFVFSGPVVADHGVGGVQDILGRPVVLLQADHHGIRIYFFKIEDVPDIGTAELVDRLVVVTHDAEVFMGACQKAYQFELGSVGVLVFIHHDIAKALLIHLQYFVVGVEKLHGQHEKIVKIQRIIFAQKALVFLIGHADLLLAETDTVVFLPEHKGSQKLVFGSGNTGEDLPLPQVFCVDAESLAGLLHQCLLIIGIIDRESRLIAQQINVAPQNADAHGMESGDPDSMGISSQDLIHPLPHLTGSLVGKGDRENIPGIHLTLVDQICDAVRDHTCLSAAGTRQDQDRSLRLEAGFLLLPVQCFIYGHKWFLSPFQ